MTDRPKIDRGNEPAHPSGPMRGFADNARTRAGPMLDTFGWSLYNAARLAAPPASVNAKR